MTKGQKVSKRIRRQRQHRQAPARHSIAKQSAAVLALGLGLAAAAPAEAAIIYTQLPGDGKTLDNNESWEFLTYTGNDPQFLIFHYSLALVDENVQSGQISRNVGANAYLAAIYGGSGPLLKAKLLQAGDSIGVSSGFTWGDYGYLGKKGYYDQTNFSYGYFLGKKGYAGLCFNPGDGLHYAWAEVSMLADGTSVTIYGYAYETEAGKSIQAGAVPLPSSLLLLGSGAAGLLAYRRRRRAA